MFLLYMISESNASSLKRLKVLVKKKRGGDTKGNFESEIGN